MDETQFKEVVAKNIAFYRKHFGFTQSELAEKLNYTDKSISKWERAETLPDVFILNQLADLFNITLNDFIKETNEDTNVMTRNSRVFMKKKIVIPIMALLLNFFVATIIYCSVSFFKIPVSNAWLVFIYATSSASILLIVFSSLWWKKTMTAVCVSILNWSFALSLFLSVSDFNNKSWLFFIIAGTFQILILTWSIFGNTKK